MLLLRSTLLVLALSTITACDKPVEPLDHFKCYAVEGQVPEHAAMRLEDQFHVEEDVQLVKLRYFCNPVTKSIGEEPRAAAPDEDHLTCYLLKPKERVTATVSANNQFGETEFMTRTSELLCVPTRKLDFEISDDPDCPGGEGCCCNMPDGAGGTWPDCAPGFECRRQANPTNPNDAIQVCVATGTPAGAPLQLHPSQPPFCRN